MMKQIASFFAGFILALALAASAATLTITTTAPQAARIATAVGAELGLNTGGQNPVPRDATAAEVKDWVIQKMRECVQGYELRQSVKAVTPPSAFDPT